MLLLLLLFRLNKVLSFIGFNYNKAYQKNREVIRMKEIEILVEVYDDLDIIKNLLSKYKYIGLKHTVDEYYYDPKKVLFETR